MNTLLQNPKTIWEMHDSESRKRWGEQSQKLEEDDAAYTEGNSYKEK